MAHIPKKPLQSGKKKARTPASGSATAPKGREMQRRQVLKGVVAGSGVVATAMALPSEWTKPVVQSIVASAHAGVSPPLSPPPLSPPPLPPAMILPTSPGFFPVGTGPSSMIPGFGPFSISPGFGPDFMIPGFGPDFTPFIA